MNARIVDSLQPLRRRTLLLQGAAATAALVGCATPAPRAPLRFVTGPFRPTEAETRALWGPLAMHVGSQLGRDVEFLVRPEWRRVEETMLRQEADVALMGGAWRYALARSRGLGPAIATVRFAGQPTYRALIIARRGLETVGFPESASGRSMSFTHDTSTTGWLVPYAWLVRRGVDPRSHFRYRAAAQHAENELKVARGEVDFATDHDNNRSAMISRGQVSADAVPVVWTSEPVPQDPIAVRAGLDPTLTARLQDIFSAIDIAQGQVIPMPPGYNGFVRASHADYASVMRAGELTGRLPKSS
jgi:phosphonate transport system substrate-binding protein